jgi:hypothetical protein
VAVVPRNSALGPGTGATERTICTSCRRVSTTTVRDSVEFCARREAKSQQSGLVAGVGNTAVGNKVRAGGTGQREHDRDLTTNNFRCVTFVQQPRYQSRCCATPLRFSNSNAAAASFSAASGYPSVQLPVSEKPASVIHRSVSVPPFALMLFWNPLMAVDTQPERLADWQVDQLAAHACTSA